MTTRTTTRTTTRSAKRSAAGAMPAGAGLDLAAIRRQFPSLGGMSRSKPPIYADNPGGTQVPQRVLEAVSRYYLDMNANTHGAFITSQRTDTLLAASHAAMADMLNAPDPHEIVFGPNMTSLTFAISRAIGRTLQPGDEVVVTALDHDANVSPWRMLAEDRGLTLRMVDVDLATCTLDMRDFQRKITPKTKIVAVGWASNAVGTVNDVATITRWAHAVGALVWVDAVQYAPHAPVDVQALGCDFLACSAYKFFGPHQGIVWGKREHLERLTPYKVRPASEAIPDRWETGTQAHELQAGTLAAVDYLATLAPRSLKRVSERFPGMHDRRLAVHAAMDTIQTYERGLVERLLAGLKTLPGVTLYGLTDERDPEQMARRVPTVMLNIAGHTPRALAEGLAARSIYAWDGNYYALTLMERLGLEEHGGALRLGLAHYNTAEEVDQIIAALHEITGK